MTQSPERNCRSVFQLKLTSRKLLTRSPTPQLLFSAASMIRRTTPTTESVYSSDWEPLSVLAPSDRVSAQWSPSTTGRPGCFDESAVREILDGTTVRSEGRSNTRAVTTGEDLIGQENILEVQRG